MVQTIITLDERQDRIVNVVKGQFGLKNKSDAVQAIIDRYGAEILEPALRPEYASKLEKIRSAPHTTFANASELRSRLNGVRSKNK